MDSFVSNFITMMGALAVVIALAWLSLRLLRSRLQPRASPGRGDEVLRFVRALPVGTKERIVMVEYRGARWMLGVTAGGISTIAHWPAQGGPTTPDAGATVPHATGSERP